MSICQAAVPALLTLTTHPQSLVSRYARKALQRIDPVVLRKQTEW
jgi:hypothetical protein